MAQQTEPTRDPYNLTSDQQELFNRAMMILLGIGIGWLLFAGTGYATNVFTEILGVAGTFFVLDYWVRRRDKQQEIKQLRQRLLREARSSQQITAINSLEEIRDLEMLTGENGLLKGENLRGVRWRKAPLTDANLENANLQDAKLINARLLSANLMKADLSWAKLTNADLDGAELVGAKMCFVVAEGANFNLANLDGTDLRGANLQNAKMINASLHGANLKGANLSGLRLDETTYFNEETILPDGTKYKYGTNMRQFTDPDHPDFWQPDWAKGSTK